MISQWRKSTCRTFSEFARKLVLAQPVVMTTRNLSLDNLIELVNSTRADLAKLLETSSLSAQEESRLFDLLETMKKAFYQIADVCILN